MRKVYLEGKLGEKFGDEWTLAVNTPAEALQAIAVQRPGFRQFLIDGEGIEGYEILVDDKPIDSEAELVLANPGMSQAYSFVPVIAGSKSKLMTMVLGVTLVAVTGGFGAGMVPGFMSNAVTGAGMVGATATGAGAAAAGAVTGGISAAGTYTLAGAAAAAGTSTTAILAAQGASYLGMGLVLAGAAAMLTPEVDDGGGAEAAENYLFNGPINTVKQGGAVPLVYGRAIVGSTTISGSLVSQTSRTKISAGRKMVGISNFRTDGSTFGTNNNTIQQNQYEGIYNGIGEIP